MSSVILGPELNRERECEIVLRSLPLWFGIEESLLMHARDSVSLPSFAFTERGHLVAFLSLAEHFSESWEVHCLAVHASVRNLGYGSRLLVHAEKWLAQRDVKFLQIKILAQAGSSQTYRNTVVLPRQGICPAGGIPTAVGATTSCAATDQAVEKTGLVDCVRRPPSVRGAQNGPRSTRLQYLGGSRSLQQSSSHHARPRIGGDIRGHTSPAGF